MQDIERVDRAIYIIKDRQFFIQVRFRIANCTKYPEPGSKGIQADIDIGLPVRPVISK